MNRPRGRGDYCREQAAECAAAATATALAEAREAYLNLEQGWMQLAPEIEEVLSSTVGTKRKKPTNTRNRPAAVGIKKNGDDA